MSKQFDPREMLSPPTHLPQQTRPRPVKQEGEGQGRYPEQKRVVPALPCLTLCKCQHPAPAKLLPLYPV